NASDVEWLPDAIPVGVKPVGLMFDLPDALLPAGLDHYKQHAAIGQSQNLRPMRAFRESARHDVVELRGSPRDSAEGHQQQAVSRNFGQSHYQPRIAPE